MTPLTMLILISFFCSFAVLDNPDGTLAHVSSFIPFSAPITMPPRIALGEAPAVEILAAFAVTVAGSAGADPAGGADLQRRRPPHRLRGEDPRGLAGDRLEGQLLGAGERRLRLAHHARPLAGGDRGRPRKALLLGKDARKRPPAAWLSGGRPAERALRRESLRAAESSPAAASSSSTCMSCARTAAAIASRISVLLSIDVFALVICCLIRSTSPMAPLARSIASRIADASIPSASPRAISTRARASE